MKRPSLCELNLREKIGQTAALSPHVINIKKNPHEYLKKNPFGVMWTTGFVNMDFINVASEMRDLDHIDYDVDKKLREFTAEADSYMKVPFIHATDAESGIGAVFPIFRDVPSQIGRAAARDAKMAERAGKCIGKSARLAGAYWLWGPVADNASPFCGVLNTRCFSSDPELSSKMIEATVKGMQSEGVAATLKHFPGAGKHEYRDSHFSDMTIRDDYDTWYNRQGRIFEAGIKAGALSVMIQHSSFPAIDDTVIGGKFIPSTLSKKIITGLLKEKMGFKGVVITDAVDMGALFRMFENREDFYAALYNAGNDVILGPPDENFIDIVEKAVKNGKIPEERIDDACEKVLDMKEKLGMFEENCPVISDEKRLSAAKEISELNAEYAPKIITTLKNSDGLFPVKKENIKRVQLIYLGYSKTVYNNLRYAKAEFEAHGAVCDVCDGLQSPAQIREYAKECDLIVYFSHIAAHSPMGFPSYYEEKARELLNVLSAGREKSIVVSTGSMFVHYDWFPAASTAICLYSSEEGMLRTLVKGLYGECEFTGIPPFDPDPLAERV